MLKIPQDIAQFEEEIAQNIAQCKEDIAQCEEKKAKKQKELHHFEKIQEYFKKIQENEYRDTPKKQYITESKLNNTDLAYSEILKYDIKEQEKITSTGEKTKYRNLIIIVIKSLFHTMSIEEIKKHGNLNLLQTKENGKKGYHWCDDIQMSLQSKSATETLKGIVKMIKVSKFNIELSIKLKTGSIVHFKI